MTLLDYTDSPFARRPRLHHKPSLAGHSSAGFARRNLVGMMGGMMDGGGAKPWSNPYVTDGLVSMWDGEWNAGGGVHDANATSWKELVGGTDCAYSLATKPTWGKKWWQSLAYNDGGYFDAFWADGLDSAHTIEIVAMKDYASRGVIIGSYNIPGANYCSMEWYTGKNLRAYYVGNPDLQATANSFPVGSVVYNAARHSSVNYEILSSDASVLKATTNSNNKLSKSAARIGCDARTTSMCFGGRIYCIRVYNRALTDAEIKKNAAVDATRFGAS